MDIEIPLRTDPATGARLLRENRALLIRHAVDAGVMQRYGAAVQAGYSDYMGGFAPLVGDAGKIARYRNEHFRRLHAAAGLAPHAVVRSLAHSAALQTLFAYFETDRLASDWEHLVSVMGVWRYAGIDHGLPYHQNGREGAYMVRAWILVYPTSANDVAAGLEFLPTRGEPAMLPIEDKPTSIYPHAETAHAAIRELEMQQSSWAPLIRIGDVVLITGDCLHRTRFPEHFLSDRFAIQATFYPAREGISCYFTRNGVEFPTDDNVAAQARGETTAEAFELIR